MQLMQLIFSFFWVLGREGKGEREKFFLFSIEGGGPHVCPKSRVLKKNR
jgi:hypothetical protein